MENGRAERTEEFITHVQALLQMEWEVTDAGDGLEQVGSVDPVLQTVGGAIPPEMNLDWMKVDVRFRGYEYRLIAEEVGKVSRIPEGGKSREFFHDLDIEVNRFTSILMTPNHPANPFLTTEDGQGILPAQASWVLKKTEHVWSKTMDVEQAYDYIYAKVVIETVYQGFGFTHQNLPVGEN